MYLVHNSLVTIYLCAYLFLYENNLFKKNYLSDNLGKLIKKVFIVFLKIISFSLTTYLFIPTYFDCFYSNSVAQVNPGIFLQDVEKLMLNLICFSLYDVYIFELFLVLIHENTSQINSSGEIFSL